MKHVWLQCEALVKLELDKLASGRQDDEMDDAPLSKEDYQLVTVAFMVKYDWNVPPKRMVGDSLLGKIRRQFLNNSVTLMPVCRTTCLADSTRGHEPTRQRLGLGNPVGSHLEWVTSLVDAVPCRDTRSFLRLLKLLSTGWAVAGCYKVTWSRNEMLYAHWQECDAWYGTFDEVAWKWVDDYGDVAAHSKGTAFEERFRVAAIEITRVPTEEEVTMSWREALLRALTHNWRFFTEARQELVEQVCFKAAVSAF